MEIGCEHYQFMNMDQFNDHHDIRKVLNVFFNLCFCFKEAPEYSEQVLIVEIIDLELWRESSYKKAAIFPPVSFSSIRRLDSEPIVVSMYTEREQWLH